jgi:hypothetical protein
MIAALPTLAILTAPASTTVAANSHHRSHMSRHRSVPTAQPPARIACTEIGCQSIPAACTPVPGRTWTGMPTGYDVIVCPPR